MKNLIAITLLSLIASGCAGYQIGARSMYRPDVSTVHVPIFRSSGFRRFQGERLTEAVIKRIEATTPYKVVSAGNADTTLEGELVPLEKRALAETANDDVRDIETTYKVRVTWVSNTGEPLMQPTSFPFATADLLISQSSHFVPEAGQSIATAQQVAIDRLAAQIVEQMELTFPQGY